MSEPLRKATWIDGVAGTEDRDSQNEILKLAGSDISEMTTKGYFNDNHGSGFVNTLGRITGAKKIFKAEDCETPREKFYWDKYKRPFLYVKGYLFDDSDHPNAKSVAAIMKEFNKAGTPLDVKMSVEGKVVRRGPNGMIDKSHVRNVALTLVPANKNTGSMVIGEAAHDNIMKSVKSYGGDEQYADSLLKSMDVEVVDDKTYRLHKIAKNIETVNTMIKAMSVGYGASGPPASRVDGSTLTAEKKKKKDDVHPVTHMRKDILKGLINKLVKAHPNLSVSDAVKLSIKAYRQKFGNLD